MKVDFNSMEEGNYTALVLFKTYYKYKGCENIFQIGTKHQRLGKNPRLDYDLNNLLQYIANFL